MRAAPLPIDRAARSTDVFVLQRSGTAVGVHLWKTDKYEFDAAPTVLVNGSEPIVGAVPLDWDRDGRMDLLVQRRAPAAQGGEDEETRPSVDVSVAFGDLDSLTDEVVIGRAADQVLVFDADNDLHADLLAADEDSTQRFAWVNKGRDGAERVDLGASDQPAFAHPTSHAFADVNGDCMADLVLVVDAAGGKKAVEIWLNSRNSAHSVKDGYTKDKTYALPTGTGQLSFADMDVDGSLDLVFPVCRTAGCEGDDKEVRIAYNQARPICGSFFGKKADDCRDDDMCSADNSHYGFGDLEAFDSSSDLVLVPGSAIGLEPDTNRFLANSSLSPLMVRIGDFDIDGYPDIAAVLVDDAAHKSTAVLLHSVACSKSTCGSSAHGASRRTFKTLAKGTDAMTDVAYAFAVAFVDLDESGSLDMLVMSDAEHFGADGAPAVHGVFNNFDNDGFFLKTRGLNGVCPARCKDGPKFPDPKPYGGIQYGTSWKLTVTDLESRVRIMHGVQLSQSAYMSLQLPYVPFGLGRTSNYIDELYMGVPLGQKERHWGSWPGIIPNSQIAATPYVADDPINWQMWLFINPSAGALWVALGTLAALILSGAATWYFYRRERKEDVIEKEEMRKLFSFSALH